MTQQDLSSGDSYGFSISPRSEISHDPIRICNHKRRRFVLLLWTVIISSLSSDERVTFLSNAMIKMTEIWICQDSVLGMHACLGSSFHFTDISFILKKEGHWQHQLGGSWSSMAANTESENGDLIIWIILFIDQNRGSRTFFFFFILPLLDCHDVYSLANLP